MSEKITSIWDMISQAEKAAGISGSRKAWIYAAFTDDIYLKEWDPAEEEGSCMENILAKESRLLELRLFWAKAEFKAFRGNIGSRFYYRVITDDEGADFYDEKQFLMGLDESGKNPQAVNRNRRGREVHRLTVRNYVFYYETSGQAYVSDYRMVNIEDGKGEEGESYGGA